jgi:hypothetical protein
MDALIISSLNSTTLLSIRSAHGDARANIDDGLHGLENHIIDLAL